jgi:hypothetical protein
MVRQGQPDRVLWRARCIERCTPGSGSGPGKRNSHNDCHRVPGRLHRPSPPPITQFIDEQRAVGHGVESICAVLREQGVPVTPRTYRSVAPRTYRSWRTSPPAARVVSDAQRVDKLRSLRTGTGSAGAAHCPRGSTGAAR